jgi:hypothetical protein
MSALSLMRFGSGLVKYPTICVYIGMNLYYIYYYLDSCIERM